MAILSLAVLAATAPLQQDVAVPAARQAEDVAVITIRGPIDRYTETSFKRRLALAEKAGADAVVVDLDTPGGEVGAVLEICNAIKGSSIANTVAWVNPDAYSGGAIIALACSEIVVNDPSSTGDALPIFAPLGMLMQMNDEEREKILAPLLAEVTDSARRNGYDEKLVQGMVSLGVELWLIENKQTGRRIFIDRREHAMLFGPPPESETPAIASGAGDRKRRDTENAGETATPTDDIEFQPAAPELSGDDMIRAVTTAQELSSNRPILSEADADDWVKIEYVTRGEGPVVLRTDAMMRYQVASAVVTNDEELKAFFGATNLTRLNRSWSESMVRWLTQFWVRGILVAIFLIGMFLEMSSPGVAAPGIVAIIALALFLVPPMLTGMAGWWEVAAMALGIGLVLLEILIIPGFGVPGILGVLLLFAGMVGTFVPNSGGLFPDSPKERDDLMYGVATVMIALFASGIAMYYLGKHFRSLPVLNRLILTDEPPGEEAPTSMLMAMDSADPHAVGVGAEGVTTTPLYPVGRAEFGDRLVEVESLLGYVEPGTPVRVVSTGDFGRLIVEPIRESASG